MNRLATLLALALPTLLLAACGENTVPQTPTETTAAQCQDGQDNDSDGLSDCQDTDCQGFVFCVEARPSEVTAVECSDGADNDGDGKSDCQDSDCKSYVFCQSAESSSTACSNDLDDDGDGKVDCLDEDCSGLVFCQPPSEDDPTSCSDGLDNDGDTLFDCADPDCSQLVACASSESSATACRDGRDNDKDTKVDCADTDCQGFVFCAAPSEQTAEACQDGADNDADGKADCLDPDCQGFTFCYSPDETTAVACQDGQDNDTDGRVDCADTDCAGFIFCRSDLEVSSAACQDGLDNDSDGHTDCQDADCQGYVFCLSEESTTAACQDGADNDSDGQIDCNDVDCQGFVFCVFEERSAVACQDDQDNDSDGQTDCDDTDCQGYVFCLSEESSAEACQDEVDNDGDGHIDCQDADCAGFVFCIADESSAADCQDGQDNDGDGQIDCADPDCSGYTFCLPPSETTLAACQDEVDNDADGQTDCADPDCSGFTVCQQTGLSETTLAECSDGRDNDGDGATDCADAECWEWSTCAHYQGYPVRDDWGDTWDGQERAPLARADAEAVCVALGGRLPTATELWRNNWNSGTGDLGNNSATNYLWTRIARQTAGEYATVRLSDGAVGYSAQTAKLAYRCFWPAATGNGFDEARCHGEPGARCFAFERFWNADAADRAPLDQVAAANECAFYGAGLPSIGEWSRLIQSWLPAPRSTTWFWSSKASYWYNGSYGVPIVKWTAATQDRWYFEASTTAAVGTTTTVGYNFRCLGLARPTSFAAPSPTSCFGGCFSHDSGRAKLVADSQDRNAQRLSLAIADCRDEGATLPTLGEAQELLQAGWPNGTNVWLWLADSANWYSGGWGYPTFRWSGTGAENWGFTSNGSVSAPTATTIKYRCVWGQKKPAWPTCQAGEVIEWNGTQFVCAAGGEGSSDGQANMVEIKDSWKNAWDGIQRNTPMDWATAQRTCESLGGRLPTATEVWAVRASNNPHPSIGDVTSTSYLWTQTAARTAGQHVTVRISDGASLGQADTAATVYARCIWPNQRGDVLEGRNCYGPPDSECFTTSGGLVADTYDRVALDAAAANQECRFSGCHLPSQREFLDMVHGGAPNGSDQWQWTSEADIYFNGSSHLYGYDVVKWSGVGTGGWEFATGAATWVYGYNLYRFRCVYTPELR